MIYILDTNIIRTLLNFFPKKGKRFEEVWEKIDEKIASGEYISVDECYNELARQYSDNNVTRQYGHTIQQQWSSADDELIIGLRRDLYGGELS